VLPPMFSTEIEVGDVYVHRTAGGGGWGDPLERDPAAVAADVVNEKVSVEAAQELYGVALGDDGTVDHNATEALRAGRRKGDREG
jgi:N-methylhydantoinase B/oxoprolinase/acetone carboxylase alpha subunit